MLDAVGLTNDLPIALKSIHVEGDVDGILATMSITQHYRNDSGKKLEIMYTFPISWRSELLELTVTLGDRRMRAALGNATAAWDQYEEAIDAGNTPILVERSGLGLCTANLGNIEDGEEATVEIRYVHLLEFSGPWVDLRIPSVIAPRYGDPHKNGGVAMHESVATDILTEYPLTVRILLRGHAGQAEIRDSSHECMVDRLDDGTEITLRSSAMLDRDFFVSLAGMPDNFAIGAPDGDAYAMLAAFRPKILQKKEPMHLKILLDCSGSMAGTAIKSAKKILYEILGELDDADIVSFSRFGDEVLHDVKESPCTSAVIAEICGCIDNAQADMGGDKSGDTLVSIFHDYHFPDMMRRRRMILLVSDGCKWNINEIVQAGMVSHHRVFTVGVGSAPGEYLLRDLAEVTGGMCVLVSPGNETSCQMPIERMRSYPTHSVHVDWGEQPLWSKNSLYHLYDGERMYALALFAKKPTQPPVLDWTVDGRKESLSIELVSPSSGDALQRLAGAQRIADAGSPEEAFELALKYRLVGNEAALLLVRNREGGHTGESPLVHQIPQMMPPGYAGFGWLKDLENDEDSETFSNSLNCAKPVRNRPSEREKLDASKEKPICEHAPFELLLALAENINRETNSNQAIEKTCELLRHSFLENFLESVGKIHEIPVEQTQVILLRWLSESMSEVYLLPPRAQEMLGKKGGVP